MRAHPSASLSEEIGAVAHIEGHTSTRFFFESWLDAESPALDVFTTQTNLSEGSQALYQKLEAESETHADGTNDSGSDVKSSLDLDSANAANATENFHALYVIYSNKVNIFLCFGHVSAHVFRAALLNLRICVFVYVM